MLKPTNPLAKVQYVPIHPKDNGMRVNPDSSTAQVSAFRTVLMQLLSSTFSLSEEESLWVGYRLDRILAPLLNAKSQAIPFAVRQEMLDHNYSRLLELQSKTNLVKAKIPYNPKVLSASIDEWADALIAPIETSYSLRPFDEATMRSEILNILRDLGVGDPVNPRVATYMPTDLRTRIFTDKSRAS